MASVARVDEAWGQVVGGKDIISEKYLEGDYTVKHDKDLLLFYLW